MSYDYQLLRLRAAAGSLNELDEAGVHTEDWRAEAAAALRARYPDFDWREDAQGLRGDGAGLGQGRFELVLLRDQGCTTLMVHGSHHADQRALVSEIAALLGAAAFDLQSGRRLD